MSYEHRSNVKSNNISLSIKIVIGILIIAIPLQLFLPKFLPNIFTFFVSPFWNMERSIRNSDNDPELTSDLAIGSHNMQDPNVTSQPGTITGLMYVLYGHAVYTVGTMPTTPGLFTQSPSYNSAIITKNVPASACGASCFYHQPTYLKAYTSDGSVSGFFYYKSTFDDLDGNGTGDFVLPTSNYGFGADGTPVVNGGAFKIIR